MISSAWKISSPSLVTGMSARASREWTDFPMKPLLHPPGRQQRKLCHQSHPNQDPIYRKSVVEGGAMVLSDRENKMGKSSAAMKDVSRNVVLDDGGINLRNIMWFSEQDGGNRMLIPRGRHHAQDLFHQD